MKTGFDKLDPKLQQLLSSRTTYYLRRLLTENPELMDVDPNKLAKIFQAGTVCGAELIMEAGKMEENGV